MPISFGAGLSVAACRSKQRPEWSWKGLLHQDQEVEKLSSVMAEQETKNGQGSPEASGCGCKQDYLQLIQAKSGHKQATLAPFRLGGVCCQPHQPHHSIPHPREAVVGKKGQDEEVKGDAYHAAYHLPIAAVLLR